MPWKKVAVPLNPNEAFPLKLNSDTRWVTPSAPVYSALKLQEVAPVGQSTVKFNVVLTLLVSITVKLI